MFRGLGPYLLEKSRCNWKPPRAAIRNLDAAGRTPCTITVHCILYHVCRRILLEDDDIPSIPENILTLVGHVGNVLVGLLVVQVIVLHSVSPFGVGVSCET